MPNTNIVRRVELLPARSEGEVALNDSASRDILVGAGVAGLFFGAFLGWSMFARLDAAAYAQGSISVEGHRQDRPTQGRWDRLRPLC